MPRSLQYILLALCVAVGMSAGFLAAGIAASIFNFITRVPTGTYSDVLFVAAKPLGVLAAWFFGFYWGCWVVIDGLNRFARLLGHSRLCFFGKQHENQRHR